jgi:hypothetical protein
MPAMMVLQRAMEMVLEPKVLPEGNGKIESIGSLHPLRGLISLSLKRYGMEISKS